MSPDRRKALHDLSESALQGLWNQEWIQVLTASRDLLASALDELEALRGQVAYAESLDTENQRLRAEKAEAQRDELLAALEAFVLPYKATPTLTHEQRVANAAAAIANARGGR